jgi:transketolase
LGVEAAKLLAKDGHTAQVVSMPCLELFLQQDRQWRDNLLPKNVKRVSLEAGLTFGWERIVGSDALILGLDRFGASAPAGILAEKFGFTPQAVKEKIAAWL